MDYSMILILVVMVAVFYFMIIRPEKKKKKEEENLRNSLKEGDKITTIGGIVGKIVDIKGDNIVIETSMDRVRMELAKWSVMTNNTAQEAAQKAHVAGQRVRLNNVPKVDTAPSNIHHGKRVNDWCRIKQQLQSNAYKVGDIAIVDVQDRKDRGDGADKDSNKNQIERHQ